MNRRLAFLIAVALQLIVLGGMVGSRERVLANGTRVLLAVEAVDPIDHLAGRYIRIPLKIGAIDTTQTPFVRGDAGEGRDATAAGSEYYGPVFVELAPDGEVWKAQRVLAEGCGVPPRAPYLCGRCNWHVGNQMRVEFDFDRFYIPADGEDPSFMVRDRSHTLRARLCVPSDGHAVLEELLIDGKTWSEWNAERRAK